MRGKVLAALSVLGPVLAGCSGIPSMPAAPDWFRSSGSSAASASMAAGAPALPANFDCPPVQVRTGASTLTSSGNPAEPTALNLRYQVTIGTTARECRLGPGNTILMKVGMQGRVILGPEGGNPATVNVPVRFAIVRETVDTQVITTKLDRVTVSMPPNDNNVPFTHVTEGLDFPMPRGGDLDNYLVYVGFDPAGAEPDKKPASRARRPAKPSRPPG